MHKLDEPEGLRTRLVELEEQRAGLTASEDELDRVETRLAGADEERRLLRRELTRRLPVLRDLQVASACAASWDEMVGDERVRFCGACQKSVYNVSALAGDELASILAGDSSPCLRFYRRRDGTVLTADCPVGVRRRRRRRIASAAMVGVGAALAAAALSRPMLGEVRADAHAAHLPPPPRPVEPLRSVDPPIRTEPSPSGWMLGAALPMKVHEP